MFFPEKIKSIKKTDRVLEVGPGNTPFYRSDILLEKIFDDEDEAYLQAGATKKKNLKKKIIYYQGEHFPFNDKEFDYVICSHVLEHIPHKDIELFIYELNRISKNGYIEVPLYNFELIANLQYHLNLIYVDKEHTMHFLPKENIDLSNKAYLALRELLKTLGFDKQIIPLNLEVFGYGFEFSNEIKFIVHENFESFYQIVQNEPTFQAVQWHKDIQFYYRKIMNQFKKTYIKQKLYNMFGIT